MRGCSSSKVSQKISRQGLHDTLNSSGFVSGSTMALLPFDTAAAAAAERALLLVNSGLLPHARTHAGSRAENCSITVTLFSSPFLKVRKSFKI